MAKHEYRIVGSGREEDVTVADMIEQAEREIALRTRPSRLKAGDCKSGCPSCASDQVVPIIYGMVLSEAFEQEKAGELVIGGCVVVKDSPRHFRRACEKRW
ncbi:MAG TPA: hypothetical protein VMW62_10410 [Chloroflexota bacterium]|nr:hypothetical protein [Chloroflexota bacterium]